ncbi:MAG TPA: nickel-binding protein [Candidatus Dormibacteraeota bacterium]
MTVGPGARKSYLVECYWPGLTEARAASSTRRAEQAAAQLAAGGAEIAYRSAIIVPEDEVALCLFEAASPSDVAEVCRRAGLPYDRILQVSRLGA